MRTTRSSARTKRSNGGAATVALGLGSNLGQPRRTLSAAVAQLNRWLRRPMVSPLYRTRPVSTIPQPDYYNLVLIGDTELDAEDLLAVAKALELAHGRGAGERDGPRPLDVDLLLYGRHRSSRPELTLPHPRLRSRRFALAPLVDLAPDWLLPPDDLSTAEALAALEAEGVERVAWPPGLEPKC